MAYHVVYNRFDNSYANAWGCATCHTNMTHIFHSSQIKLFLAVRKIGWLDFKYVGGVVQLHEDTNNTLNLFSKTANNLPQKRQTMIGCIFLIVHTHEWCGSSRKGEYAKYQLRLHGRGLSVCCPNDSESMQQGSQQGGLYLLHCSSTDGKMCFQIWKTLIVVMRKGCSSIFCDL